jgi:hypothetical protein
VLVAVKLQLPAKVKAATICACDVEYEGKTQLFWAVRYAMRSIDLEGGGGGNKLGQTMKMEINLVVAWPVVQEITGALRESGIHTSSGTA